MKIGVLTYHCVPNFGAQLQTLSTVGFLKKQGHEPIVINWYAPDLEQMYSKRIPSCQIEEHYRFAQKSFSMTKKCQTEKELIYIIEELDIDGIIVGSDALFKYLPLSYCRNFSFRRLKYIYHYRPLSCEQIKENPFFGGFLSKLKNRIPASVYAASSQNCPFPSMKWIERKRMQSALANYKQISVRDAWTQEMIKKITNRNNICIYPDPVFSFNQNCSTHIPSKQEIQKKFGLPDNFVLLSFSDWHNKDSYINSIATELIEEGFFPVALPMPEKLVSANIEKHIKLPLSPLDWYALIIHSCGFIGERMHPIVVCLHNDIPFFGFDEYGIKDPLSKKYNPHTSKTYQIVSEAKLNNNLFSYKKEESLPSPHEVVVKIKTFDHKKCISFLTQKKKDYEQGMLKIIDSLRQ